MACIKYVQQGLLLIGLLGLVACGGTQKKENIPAEEPRPTALEEGADNVAGEAPLVLISNPYLSNPPSVPGRAKDEFANAVSAMNANQWKDAEGMLTLMTETYPSLSGPYVNLGVCLYHREKWDDAEAALKKAITVNKTNMDAYTALGVLYREQGKFTDAEQTYLAALSVWPHHAESHRNLGILYDLYMGKFTPALEHYKMLQRLLPEENRQVKGWVIDLERRLGEMGVEIP